MGIKLAEAEVKPSIKYEYVFMTKLEIEQVIRVKAGQPLLYNVTVEYRLFGLDAEGNRHFQSETKEIHLKDYLLIAMQKAQQGDLDMIVAMQSIEKAIASIIEDQTGVSAEVVSG